MYLFFKIYTFLRRHRICFSDDGNDVDFIAEPLHELYIEGLEAVPAGSYEVEAAMHACVGRRRLTRHSRLGVEEFFVLRLNEVDDRLPTKIIGFDLQVHHFLNIHCVHPVVPEARIGDCCWKLPYVQFQSYINLIFYFISATTTIICNSI